MPIENANGPHDNRKSVVYIHHTELVNLYDCVIGEGTKIGTFVEIGNGVSVGKRCKIQSFAFIPPGVTIGDNVFIGPHVCFTNVKRPRLPDPPHFEPTIVKDDVVIGANSTIVCGITIGKGAFIGAGSVVTKDVPDGAIVYGNPAMPKFDIPNQTLPEEYLVRTDG